MVSSLRPSWLHAPYWVLPVCASVAWLGLLLGLLLWWIVDDHAKRYQSNETSIVFISDIGAEHETLMIAGTACTWAFYAASLLAERVLRHIGRLPATGRRSESVLGWIVVFLGFCGGAALLFLSIFNAFDYGTAHWSLTYTFGGCCLTSAVLQTTEVYRISTWLGRGPQARSASFSMTAAQEEAAVRTRRSLRRIALAKAVVLGACLLAGVGFAVTYGLENTLCNNAADFLGEGPNGWRCNLDGSFSAACEWVIAFLIVIYLVTLVWDLLPARQTYGLSKAAVLRHQGQRDLLPTTSVTSPPGSPAAERSSIMRQASGEFGPVVGAEHGYAETAFEPLPMGWELGVPVQGRSREMSFGSSVGGAGYKVAGSEAWEEGGRGVGYRYP